VGEGMKTIDRVVYNLCKDVDYWKEKAFEFEHDYNELNKKYNALLDSSLKHAQAMAGNQLKLILGMQPGQLETVIGK
jgi:hypothetical protein